MRFFLRIVVLILFSIVGLFVFRSIIDVSIFGEDLGSFGGFLQIIGTLYGIMAAFTVFVVWDRYNKIKEVAEQETDSLSELYALTTYLEDDQITTRMKNAIEGYAKAVIKRGWEKLYKGEKSNKASEVMNQIYEEIKNIKSERKRFPVIFGQMVEKFEDVSDLRTQRVTMSTERLPKSLKSLILFDSIALILAVFMLPIANFWLAIFVTLVTSGTVILTLNVIFDLDNPLAPGEWSLTPESFENLIKELEERG